jgi:hypothetical protein
MAFFSKMLWCAKMREVVTKMLPRLSLTWLGNFTRDTSGAVTVDWTVLSAAVVGLGVASVGAVRMGTNDLGGDIQTSLTEAFVKGNNYLQGSGFDPAGLIWWPGGSAAHWYGYPGQIEGWVLADPRMRVDVMPHTRYDWLAAAMPNGGQVLELGGNPGEALDISQTFNAAPGTPLTVSFRAGTHSPSAMRVWFGNTLLQDISALPSQRLENYTFNVTAGESGTNVLRFEATQTTGWDGPLLTDVSVR